MGNNSNKQLSKALEDEVTEIFNKIDIDHSKTIDKEETIKYWQGNFSKLNTEALFQAVDVDKNGKISLDEWVDFWRTVHKLGNSEQEIREELDNLKNGQSWVQFEKK